jgi:membrane associated rhomboid family serine protease
MIIGFALLNYLPDFTSAALALNPQAVLSGRIWQLLTYPFVNGGCSLIGNGILLLFLGSAVEREWRTWSFLFLWLVVSVLCGLIWIGISIVLRIFFSLALPPGATASACGYGVIGAFGLLFLHRRFLVFFWTMEAQQFAWLLVAIGLVIGIAWPPMWIWVAGAGVAFVYLKLIWKLREGFSSGGQPVERERFKDLG